MKEKRPGSGKRSFRIEWEESEDGRGSLFLFGVRSIGVYENDRKSFQTAGGVLTVNGRNVHVLTFRSGAVGLVGEISAVSFDKDGFRKGREDAAD